MSIQYDLNPFQWIIPPIGSAAYARILYRTPREKISDTFAIFYDGKDEHDEMRHRRLGLIDYCTMGLLVLLELPAVVLLTLKEPKEKLASYLFSFVCFLFLLPALIIFGVSRFVLRPVCALILTFASLLFVILVHFIVKAMAKRDFELLAQLPVTDLAPEEFQRYEQRAQIEIPPENVERIIRIMETSSLDKDVVELIKKDIRGSRDNLPSRAEILQQRPKVLLSSMLTCDETVQNRFRLGYSEDCGGLYIFDANPICFALSVEDTRSEQSSTKLAYQALLRLNLFHFQENHQQPYVTPNMRAPLFPDDFECCHHSCS